MPPINRKVLSLGYPGRSANVGDREADSKKRRKGQKDLEEKVSSILEKKGVHSSFFVLDPKDVVFADEYITFVGCGLVSNQAGFDFCLQEQAFTSHTVAHVRDIFDRSHERPNLSSVFLFSSSDTVFVNENLFDNSKKRLVNEYVRDPNGGYQLSRHDLEFTEFVHSLGFRIIPTKETGIEFQKKSTQFIPERQSTNSVLMVAPTSFLKNLDAAQGNTLMTDLDIDTKKYDTEEKRNNELQRKALSEFSQLHLLLTQKVKVEVNLFTHEPYHDTPDAVFPNNWFSTHADFESGECTLVLYPMKVPNRRKERRPDFFSRLESFQRYTHVFDLTRQETASSPSFLEGTGSLVLDRINKIAYVALSERADLHLAQKWGKMMQYEVITFSASDEQGRPFTHTDVILSIGTKVAILCVDAIKNPEERKLVVKKLTDTKHEIVEITQQQVLKFCGNVIELENWRGYPVMAMSTGAFNAFTENQKKIILKYESEIVHADFSTLEKVGGGGVRSAIAELF